MAVLGQERVVPDLTNRIAINPEQCGGRPSIRSMRIRVVDVLALLAAGLSAEQVLEEMPDLEREDIQAALQYAARSQDHPALAASEKRASLLDARSRESGDIPLREVRQKKGIGGQSER
jgi:uncharacterized protein (DUF433 family)